MTYMAGLGGSFILECSGFPGDAGSLDFLPNENVYFLGTQEVTDKSAESIGFTGYYFIPDSPSACVDEYDAQGNLLHLVQAGDLNLNIIFPPRNRGFIRGDIVVGGTSGAVRSVGKSYALFDGYERCSIKEINYISQKHDLLNFPDKINYNRQSPFNTNFFSNTKFNNFDNRFSCLSVNDRYALPVPYTANKFGFKTVCAVTPQHVVVASHVVPYSTNSFSFYNTSSQSIINREVIAYKAVNGIANQAFQQGLYVDNSYINGDLTIGLLNEPLPNGCTLANIPAHFDVNNYPDYISIDGIMVCADYGAMC